MVHDLLEMTNSILTGVFTFSRFLVFYEPDVGGVKPETVLQGNGEILLWALAVGSVSLYIFNDFCCGMNLSTEVLGTNVEL